MNRHAIITRWRRLWRNLTLDGQLRIARRWLLLPGPLLLLFALFAPYNGLFFIAYVYLLLVVAAYLWVRTIGPRVRLQRRMRSEWAQVGDELEEQWELFNDGQPAAALDRDRGRLDAAGLHRAARGGCRGRRATDLADQRDLRAARRL